MIVVEHLEHTDFLKISIILALSDSRFCSIIHK